MTLGFEFFLCVPAAPASHMLETVCHVYAGYASDLFFFLRQNGTRGRRRRRQTSPRSRNERGRGIHACCGTGGLRSGRRLLCLGRTPQSAPNRFTVFIASANVEILGKIAKCVNT